MSKLALRIILLLMVFLVIFSTAFAELQPINIKREIAETVKPGETIQLKINLKFIGEKPSGIIITEYLPQGWEITSALPKETKFKDKVSWLLYGEEVKDSTIVYELKAPSNLIEPVSLRGEWETLTEKGLIEGDMVVNITQESAPGPPAPSIPPQQDNTMLYVGVAIIVVLLVIIVAVMLKKKK